MKRAILALILAGSIGWLVFDRLKDQHERRMAQTAAMAEYLLRSVDR